MNKKFIVFPLLCGLVGASIFVWSSYDKFVNQQPPPPAVTSPKASAQTAKSAQKGQEAPDFTLTGNKGETLQLSAFRGKKVILNFWATWCPPCKAESPEFEKFYEDNKDQNVVILSVNLTSEEREKGDVENFIHKYHLTYPVALDLNREASGLYRISAIPTTYLIDSSGILQQKFVGQISYDALAEAVAALP